MVSATENIQARRDPRFVDKFALSANTIEQLAEKMKISVIHFGHRSRYNELARMVKTDFGKRPDRLTPLDRPPFCW
jgi:hypothetical protein